jgi:hypothetical protein
MTAKVVVESLTMVYFQVFPETQAQPRSEH